MGIIPIYFHRDFGAACPHLIDIRPPTQLVAQLEIKVILKYSPYLTDSNLGYIPSVYSGLQLLTLLHGTPEYLKLCNPCVDVIAYTNRRIYPFL
jgi:hypothetical protein